MALYDNYLKTYESSCNELEIYVVNQIWKVCKELSLSNVDRSLTKAFFSKGSFINHMYMAEVRGGGFPNDHINSLAPLSKIFHKGVEGGLKNGQKYVHLVYEWPPKI